MNQPLEGSLKEELRSMDPYDFEHFIADLWEERGWTTEVTTASNDGGIDVVATKDGIISEKHLIQAKCNSKDNRVGSPEMQQYAGLKSQEQDADAIIVVTTSEFTDNAEDVAHRSNIKCINVEDLCSVIEDLECEDLVARYSAYQDIPDELRDSKNSNSKTQEVTQDNSKLSRHEDSLLKHLEETSVGGLDSSLQESPVLFEEIHRNVPASPPDDGLDGQMELAKRFFQNLLYSSILQNDFLHLMTDEHSDDSPGSLVNYFFPSEQPAFVLTSSRDGFSVNNESKYSPSGDQLTYHVLTNQRLVSVVGGKKRANSVSIPLSEITEFSYHETNDSDGGLFSSSDTGDDYFEINADHDSYQFYSSDLGDTTLHRQIEMYLCNGPHEYLEPSREERLETVQKNLRSDQSSPYKQKLVSLLEEYLDDRDRTMPSIKFEFDQSSALYPYEYEEGIHKLQGLNNEKLNIASQIADELKLEVIEETSRSIAFGRRYIGPDNAETESVLIQYLLEILYEITLFKVTSAGGEKYSGWS